MNGQGYLLIDERAAGLGQREWDTEQCPHCERILKIATQTIHAEAYCMRCGARVCPDGPCATHCTPFLRRLEAQRAAIERFAARDRLYDSIGGQR